MPGSALPDLIALVFESACDPDRLGELAEETGHYFAADGVAIAIWPRRSPAAMVAATHGLSEADVQGWFAAGENPGTLLERLQTQTPLEPFDGPSGATPANGWPDGAVLATVVTADADNIFALILTRQVPGRFSQADRDSLDELARYLQRGVALNKRLIRWLAERRAARLLLDSAPRGIFLLGQRGQATYMNDEARRICGAGDGVALENDELRFPDPVATQNWHAFLDRAGAKDDETGHLPTTGMTIKRPSQAPAYQLIAYGLDCDPRKAALDEREGLAVAMLHDPSVAEVPDEGLLHTYFGLTPAESQLTRALCDGQSLPLAAKTGSISINTARTHLRSVFQKVGVHSQVALVQRVTQSLHLANPLD